MSFIDKLEALVQQRPLSALSPTVTLAGAIWQVRLSPGSHPDILDQLPAFIDAELDHRSGTIEFLALKRHLLLCPDCALIYFDLLEIALLDQAHGFPKPDPLPRPDLSFLKPTDKGE